MPSLLDPAAVISALAGAGDLTRRLAPELRRPATAAVEAVLKARKAGLHDLRAFHAGLGDERFALAMDAASAAAVRAAVKRLDPHAPPAAKPAAQIDAQWARRHLVALAAGEAAPAEKPEPLDRLLPAKRRSPEALRALAGELGPERFLASLGAMSKAAPRGFVKALDPENPAVQGKVSGIDAEWARRRIAEIASLEGAGDTGRGDAPDPDWFDRLQRIYATRPRSGR